MTTAGWVQLVVLIVLIIAGTRVLGPYLAAVFTMPGDRAVEDEPSTEGAEHESAAREVADELAAEADGGGGVATAVRVDAPSAGAAPPARPHAPGDRVFGPIERLVYRLCGIDERREQRWSTYALSLLAFSLVSVVVVYLLQRFQGSLPINPNGVKGVPPFTAFNTAVSFVTNTNWQNYAGESTMSHLTQMAALTVQNFVSAAVGLSVAVALIRGLVRRRSSTIGNFWVDLVRGLVRVLLPLALILAVVYASQGVIQNLHGNTVAHTLEHAVQVDPGRSHRQPGGHQGARHQRRRLPQRQLVPPVREPERLHQPAPDLQPPAHPVLR